MPSLTDSTPRPSPLVSNNGRDSNLKSDPVFSGPRVFMDCAVDQNRDELETWFINLWNHFVIPYLMGAIMAGIEVCVCVNWPSQLS